MRFKHKSLSKRKVALIAVLVLAVVVVLSCTAAYFTTSNIARNVITTGDIQIAVEETMINEDGKEVPYVNPEESVMPGDVVSKIVKVKNTGDNAAFVRIAADKEIVLSDGTKGDTSLINLNINKKDWEEKDGYYYYKTPLEKGKTTEPLFTQVTFKKDADKKYMNSKINININTQAVQVANNGTKATDAAGWPDKK